MSQILLRFYDHSHIPKMSGTYMAWLTGGIFAEVTWDYLSMKWRAIATMVDVTNEVEYWASPPSLNAMKWAARKEA